MTARLEAVVTAEAQCCAFLGLRLHDASPDVLRLTIISPDDEAAQLMLPTSSAPSPRDDGPIDRALRRRGAG